MQGLQSHLPKKQPGQRTASSRNVAKDLPHTEQRSGREAATDAKNEVHKKGPTEVSPLKVWT
jgi:hypothetical protein